MIREYRKYLEPRYGKVAPEVVIDPPQSLDFSYPAESRTAIHMETISSLVGMWKNCSCYPQMMKISTKNVTVEHDGYQIPVRIYYPAKAEKCPIMIYYHGGGFMMNNPDVYDQVNRYLAAYGDMIVISPDYRLSPEHRFPTAPEDCYKVLEWVDENRDELGGAQIFVGGDSAGGNLATVMTQMARDRKGPEIAGQVILYPVLIFNTDKQFESELHYGEGHFLEHNSLERSLNGIYLNNDAEGDLPYVSPLCAESVANLPPACFMSAECDPLLDQVLMYAARFEDEGVPFEYHLYEGMIHGFINRPYRSTMEALATIIAFVQRNHI